MYDLQSYLGKMSAGLLNNEKLVQAKYGRRRKTIKLWQAPKVEAPFFVIQEDDLP